MSEDDSESGRGTSTDTETESTGAPLASPSSDYKVRGKKQATDATGVLGWNTATSGPSYGVEGVTDSGDDGAAGVRGVCTATTGGIYGVLGFGDTPSAQGVVGAASEAVPLLGFGGTPTGVWGYTDKSPNDANVDAAYGVYGQAAAGSGRTYGVYGTTSSADGYAVYADGDSKTAGAHEVGGVVSRQANTTAFLSSQQQIAGNLSNIEVNFDAIVDGTGPDTAGDDFDAFDTSNHRYVVPVAGDYRVDVSVAWDSTLPEGTRHDLKIYVNGTNEAHYLRATPSTGGDVHFVHDHGGTVLMGLSKGDEIQAKVAQNTGSDKFLDPGREKTFISISHVG